MPSLRVCLLAALLVPGIAGAKKPVPAADKEPAPQILTYGEGDEVEGGVFGPDGNVVGSTRGSKHHSLVRVRTTFIPELLKSALDR